MSFELMALAVRVKIKTVPKMVLLMLADRTNRDTGRCDPSLDRLADDCGMSKTSVKEAIKLLVSLGLVTTINRKFGDVNLPNQYQLNLAESWVVGRQTPEGGAADDLGGGAAGAPKPIILQPVIKPKEDLATENINDILENPVLNNIEREKKITHIFVLPEWVNEVDWKLWLKTRKGKKMIPEQMQTQVDKLTRWRDAGLDHTKALADAAAAGWQGIFEPKPSNNTGLKKHDRSYIDNSAPARVRRANGLPEQPWGHINGEAVRQVDGEILAAHDDDIRALMG